MKNLRFSLNLLAGALLALGLTTAANAQATRTWVSGVGDDANPCSRTAPCKTFAGAISKTAAGGEIDCLDPGGFGTVTITKSITIDCDSGVGSILASGTNGINISANAASDVIYIRNLTINGTSQGVTPGLNGIVVNSAKTVHLQEVDIFDFTTSCVTVNGSAASQLTIENSSFTNCGTNGVQLTTTTGTVLGDFHNTRIWNCGNGINAGNGARLNVFDSVISFNTVGINQSGLAGGASTAMVAGSTLAGNSTALQSGAPNGFLGASGNTFINNTGVVYNINGGNITTAGDNPSFGNTAAGVTSGALPKI
jgi:hypothetical protein